MEFSGRLAAFPMADLLQWAKNEACTGALVIRRSQREKRIYFNAGDVVGCLSNDPAEFYGQYLLLHGHLERDPALSGPEPLHRPAAPAWESPCASSGCSRPR